MADLYGVLDVPKKATKSEIKRAYRRKAVRHHPDKGGDKKTFALIALAHDVLTDDARRQRYDESGDTEIPKSEAFALIAMLVSQIADVAAELGMDLVSQVKMELDKAERELKKQIDGGTKKIERLRKVAKRVSRKSSGDNMIARVILGPVPEIERAIASSRKKLDDVKEAREIIADYKYDTDGLTPKRPESPSWVTMGSFSWK